MFIGKKKPFCGYICYKYIVQNNLCENLLTHRQFLEKWLPPNYLTNILNIQGTILRALLLLLSQLIFIH